MKLHSTFALTLTMLLVCMTPVPRAAGVDVTLEAAADTWIGIGKKDDRAANHGGDAQLELGRFSIFSDTAILIQFDLSGIPDDALITSATLHLSSGSLPYNSSDQFELSFIEDAWDEFVVSGDLAPETSPPSVVVNSSSDPSIDITEMVGNWVGGITPNHGLQIQNLGFNHSGNFVSREGTGNGPSLEISYIAGPPCPEDINMDGQVDVVDLLALLVAWGELGGPADINSDGIVNVADLLVLLIAWGPCA